MPYDYSQPVVVNNYVTSDAEAAGGAAQATAPAPETSPGMQQFDAGLAQFKSGDYRQALASFNDALKQLPGDPVVHEVRALSQFAIGDYPPAAAALNSLLSSAPGMDWTTMSGLYGNVADYTTQLRKLEQFCVANPKNASSAFVLAYHYLVTGAKDSAVAQLKVVVANQPKDVTAKRMLDALAPTEAPVTPASSPPTSAAPAGSSAPETDLVGTWRATPGDTTIELKISEDSQFSWQATQAGQPAVTLKGKLIAGNDGIVMESVDKGSMAGSVRSGGPDKWQFTLSGAPPSQPGLDFVRVK